MEEFESSINIATGSGFRLRVKGLNKTLRALEKSGADAEDMRDLMHEIGTTVVSAAAPHVPRGNTHSVRVGPLASTLRAGRGKTKAVARAGKQWTANGKVRYYAPIIHYGYPARGIRPRPFLLDALQASQGRILAQLTAGIGDILDKNSLDNDL